MFNKNFIFPFWLRVPFYVTFVILGVCVLALLFDACVGQTYLTKKERKFMVILTVSLILLTILAFLISIYFFRDEVWVS